MKNIANIRMEYSKKSLNIDTIGADPIIQFNSWFKEALEGNVKDANAMNLATSTKAGKPSARIVLLKGVESGFVFYTNYESSKGQELADNPQAALTFFWPELERQVRIEGVVEKIAESASNEYFDSRPRESQIGAWASPQSEVIGSRAILDKGQKDAEMKYEGKKIPRPEHWGGYCLEPNYIEFWQGRPSRLHDRIVYIKANDQWVISRLAP